MEAEGNIFDLKLKTLFGVEIEVNSFDLKSRPEGYRSGALPLGIHEVAFLVHKAVKSRVVVSKWCNNHNNNCWIVKPDSSCGMEICSPVLKGWLGARSITNVISSLNKDLRVKSDSRCSFHVHFDVSSFSGEELLSLICWWIKLESFFMDAMPAKRKMNPYCRLISQSNIIKDVAQNYDLFYLVENLGISKYYTLNTFHYYNKRRKTVEFRIMDNLCCLNENDALFWVALLHHFVDCCIERGLPPEFDKTNPFSGYCWLDPSDAFKFLNFFSTDLSPKLKMTRSWLINRLVKYGKDFIDFGLFSRTFKIHSYKEIRKLEKIFHQI